MKLPLAYYGEPVLRQKCAPVTSFDEELRQFVQDLFETMKANNGQGLAAPQVFRSIAVFFTVPPVQKDNGTWEFMSPRLYINPKILEVSEETWVHDEGCLSIPKVYAPVPRPLTIRVRYQDLEGDEREETLTEWPARVFLHENDHIHGVLFPDRMEKKERKKIESTLRIIKKRYKKQ